MLSISHPNASTYFGRDVNCVKRYFSRRYHFTSEDPGPFLSHVEKQMRKSKTGGRRLDVEVEASGFSKKLTKELEKYMEEVGLGAEHGNGEDSPESDEPDGSDQGSEQDHGKDHTADLSFGDGNPDVVLLQNGQISSAVHEAISVPGGEGTNSDLSTARRVSTSVAPAVS
ncbi:MAG: hypothetical protein Q9207_003785 [Kuettlingeria erythrocarpa]